MTSTRITLKRRSRFVAFALPIVARLTLIVAVAALTQVPQSLAVASPDIAAPSGPPSAAPQSAPAPPDRVTVTANRIKIAIHGMPLAEAVSQLVAATHTDLDGVAALRLAPKRVTLQWQGTSVAAAWQQLLASDPRTALSPP